jgi:hypothetical protein
VKKRQGRREPPHARIVAADMQPRSGRTVAQKRAEHRRVVSLRRAKQRRTLFDTA